MPDQHAFLPLSASKAWLSCTRMPRFTEGLPDTESDAAYEGTVAHSISEWTLRLLLGMNSEKFCKAKLKEYKALVWDHGENEGKPIYNTEMSRHVRDYVSFVMETYAEALRLDPGAKIFIETRVDVSKYIPEGFGTADIIIVYMIDGVGYYVGIDLKYGKGVLVEAEDNPQLKLYALGGAILLDHAFNFEYFEMHIFQPRLDNYPKMDIRRQALIDWAKYFVAPKAEMAYRGEGEFVVGDYCRFCRGYSKCPAVFKKAEALAMYKFARIPYLTDEQVVQVFKWAPIMSSWLTHTKEDALNETLKTGKQWPGLIFTNGRSDRQYKDADALAKRLRDAGFSEEQIYNKSIIGIGALVELLGADFDKVTAGLIHKPVGKPTLKLDDGKSEPYNKAAGKFKDLTKLRD